MVGHIPLPNVQNHGKARKLKLQVLLSLVHQAKGHATSNTELGGGKVDFLNIAHYEPANQRNVDIHGEKSLQAIAIEKPQHV